MRPLNDGYSSGEASGGLCGAGSKTQERQPFMGPVVMEHYFESVNSVGRKQ